MNLIQASKNMTEPAISREEADKLIAQGSDFRVTPERITGNIVSVGYVVMGTTTHAFLTMKNKFVIHGEAGCLDPANFKEEIGQRYAYDDAYRKLFALEGYYLASKRLEEEELAASIRDF